MTKRLEAIRDYSDEEFQAIRDDYAKGQGKSIEEIAEQTQRSTRSIIAKLTKVGEYIKPVATKSKTLRKEDLAHRIGEIVETSENDTDSLMKPTKLALAAIVEKFEEMQKTITSLNNALDEYEVEDDDEPIAA